MASKAVIVGSGAGGSLAAYVFANAAWEVVILEKGVDRFGDLAATFGTPDGTSLADWPITYHDIEPYYVMVEDILGVQGDADAHPDFLKAMTPRSAPYPMPPGPQQLDSTLLADSARTLGYHPF